MKTKIKKYWAVISQVETGRSILTLILAWILPGSGVLGVFASFSKELDNYTDLSLIVAAVILFACLVWIANGIRWFYLPSSQRVIVTSPSQELPDNKKWLPYWEQNELFTLREAAFLWAGKDPGDGRIFEGTSENAVLNMFREAILRRKLKVGWEIDELQNPGLNRKINRRIFREYGNEIRGTAASKFPF